MRYHVYVLSAGTGLLLRTGQNAEQAKKYPDMAGAYAYGNVRTLCPSSKRMREYCFEQGSELAKRVPNLRGFISISEGERPTSCVTVKEGHAENFVACPRCAGKKPGELLAMAAAALIVSISWVS